MGIIPPIVPVKPKPPRASAALAHTPGASSLLFDSFDDVPPAWHALCPNDDLGMDPKVLRVFQRTLVDQCRCWGLIVFDASGVAIGCAALCLFQTEMVESSHPAFLRWRERLRRLWPSLGKMNVLFCGLPIPSGSTHLRIRDGASHEIVLGEIDRVMQRLARNVGSRLIIFKELDHTCSHLAAALEGAGYVRGAIPPMHLLEVPFQNFVDYRNALKSRYRAQVQRSQKKLLSAGFDVLQGRGSVFFHAHFNEEIYQFYVAVQQRAEQKLELLPAAFFAAMADELGDEVLLTLIRREGRICAFTFSVTRGATHYNLYSGLDYAVNNEGDLYFNLFYHDMDQAFLAGAISLHLGQTSDAFKSRLGTTTNALFFFARARPAALHALLRPLAPIVFPHVAPVEPHEVFSTPHQRKG